MAKVYSLLAVEYKKNTKSEKPNVNHFAPPKTGANFF